MLYLKGEAKSINSHIQIPRCVFKEFAKNNNAFFKYNVEDKIISRGYPKSTFTEEGYYSDAIEGMLNRYVETPLKKMLDFARELPIKTLPIILNSDIKEIALIFVKSLIARSPNLCHAVCKNSIFFQFTSKQNQHDIVVDYAMKDRTIDELFAKFDISFMINETEVPFVLPTRGIYEYQINNVLCMNVPLNPNCAIFFKEKGKAIHKQNGGEAEIAMLKKGSDDIALKINWYALQRQVQAGKGYIVCPQKEVLEQLVKAK